MSTSLLFWLRPLFNCLTSQLYLWEYIRGSQQILISLFDFLQIKAHSSKFTLIFRSHSVLESLRKFGLALNLWKWQCSEGVVWFGFNELFLSLFPDNSWCPYWKGSRYHIQVSYWMSSTENGARTSRNTTLSLIEQPSKWPALTALEGSIFRSWDIILHGSVTII